VDDVRYLTTLEQTLAKTKSLGLVNRQRVILEVENFLKELKSYTGDDVEGMKQRMVSYIIQLNSGHKACRRRLVNC